MGELSEPPQREPEPDQDSIRHSDDLQGRTTSRPVQVIRMLTDVRFKLLVLVPTVSAIGVVVAANRTRADAIGIAIVGLVATLGILLYDLRNSQLYGAAIHRAKVLEQRMGLRRSNPENSDVHGGLF